MQLPINEKELETILKNIKHKDEKLYNKLWSFKVNFLNKGKKYGLS
jgi:hypothetical protein